MKRLFTLLLVALLSLSGGMPWAFAQYIYIYEREANRTHITDPANLAAGDVVLLQAADNASKFFRGAAQVGSIEQNSYWQLVAGDGGKFKLANYLSLQAGGTPFYVKATTTASLQPIQTTIDASQAAQFTLVNQGTGLTTNQGFIRFKTVYSGTSETFLNNATSETAGVKFATGTGGWSYWKVFKADVFANSQSISFDENAVSTHNSRYTNKVGLGDQAITWTSQAGDVIYRDLTSESMTVLVGSNLTPVIGYRGWAMYGYLYIDYNNDGDFTDEGELVSQLAGNTWASGSTADKTIPAFTITSTPGTYRARFKVEWNNTNPGGSYPTIAKDGGSITDVTVHVVKDLSPSETILKNNIYALQELYGVIDATKISSNHPQTNEGSIAALIDNTYGTDNNRSYFHSNWNSGNETAGAHDLIYELTDATDAIHFYIQQRANGTGRPENITISGSNDGSTYTPILTINMTWGGNPLDTYSSKVTASTSYKYWKFEVNSTNSTNSSNAAGSRWFCASEWYVLPSNNTTDAFFDAATQLRAAATSVDDNVRTAAITNVETAKQTLDDDIAAHTKYTITYQVVDVNSNLLAQSTAEVYGGTIIDALPSNMRRDLFYDYSTENYTAAEGLTATFTATLKSSAPFIPSTSTANPVWYGLRIHSGWYPTYVSEGTPNVTLPATNAKDATTCWAFIGDPYSGFQIINRAAGTSFVLGSETPQGDGNTGGNTYATLNAPGTKTYETWTVSASTHYTGGFFIANAQDYKLNYRSTANLAYWTGGFGQGSTFVAFSMKDWLNETIADANALKAIYDQYAGNPLFPTTAAATTFAAAIATAQGVYDNGGDYISARETLLAAMATVQANESLVTTPRTDVVYTITSPRGSWAVGSGATEINSTHANGLNLAFSADDVKQQFAFIPHGGNYYLYSVSEQKFAYIDGTKLSLSALFTAEVENCPVTFTRSTYTYAKNYPAIVTINGRHFGVHPSHNPTAYQYQALTDEGNAARLIAGVAFDNAAALAVMQNYYDNDVTYVVEDEDGNTLFTSPAINANLGTVITDLPEEYKRNTFYTYNTIDLTTTQQHTTATFTATLKPQSEWPVIYTEEGNTPVYNNLNIRSKYLVYDSEATGEIALQQNSEPFNANAGWAFIGTPYTGFKMVNKAKGTDSYLIYTSVVTGNNANNNNIQFQSAQDLGAKRWLIENNTNGFVLRMMENTAIYFHHDNGSNFLRTCSVTEWSSVHNDAGSTIIASDDFAEVESLYNALKDIPFGTALGQYSTGAISLQEASATIINAAMPIQNKTYDAYPALYAALKQLSDALSINMPQAGSFLRIKTAPAHAATNATAFNNTQPYLIGTNHTTQTTRAAFSTDASASSAANSIWYLAEISGTKYLVAYSNGYPAVKDEDQRFGVGTGTQYLASNGTSIVFEEAANKEVGTYNVKFGTNRYLFTTTGLYTDAGDAANGSNANGYNFELEAVTSLPVTVTAAGYSSLYLPVSVEIPEGVIAYIATVDQDVLRFTKVIDIIPAATPVVIEAAAGTYNFVVSAEDGSISGTNALQGSVANEACDAGVHYTLQKPANMGIGFYRYSGTKLTGFKAYLPGSAVSGSGIRGFAFEDAFIDITTGIERFDNIQSDEIYDLQGRRVTTPAKGLYIIGGKKVYIK